MSGFSFHALAAGKTVKSIVTALCMALAAAGLVAPPAHATFLFERELVPSSSDGLITFDSATRLEWLDLTATLGLSYNQAEASSFAALGFRHANETEVITLFSDADLTDLSGTFTLTNYAPVNTLLTLLGITSPSASVPSSQGIADFASPLPSTASTLFFQTSSWGGVFGRAFVAGSVPKDLVKTQIGNFLVRAAPEPGTLALFGAGLVGLGFLRRRRRSAARA